jgi:hypothetical protein
MSESLAQCRTACGSKQMPRSRLEAKVRKQIQIECSHPLATAKRFCPVLHFKVECAIGHFKRLQPKSELQLTTNN